MKFFTLNDNTGSVELIDAMGSDLSVVNAARVSFEKRSDWSYDYVKSRPTLSAKDAKLIHYLATNNHWTPFAHTCISLRVKAPLFIARQLGKSQVGLVWNEVSRRYVGTEPEFYIPDSLRRAPEGGIKQGSSDETISYIMFEIEEVVSSARELYKGMLTSGVAPEEARMFLPQNMYTEWIWTGSLAAFMRVVNLRVAKEAQSQIRKYAAAIDEICSQLFPVSHAALLKGVI